MSSIFKKGTRIENELIATEEYVNRVLGEGKGIIVVESIEELNNLDAKEGMVAIVFSGGKAYIESKKHLNNSEIRASGEEFRAWFGVPPEKTERGLMITTSETLEDTAVVFDSNVKELFNEYSSYSLLIDTDDSSKIGKLTLRTGSGLIGDRRRFEINDGLNIIPMSMTGGEPDKENGQYRVQLRSQVKTEPAVVYLKGLLVSKKKESGTVSIQYDDALSSVFTNAFPLHKKYKIPASIGVISGSVGQIGHMNEKQIIETTEQGWDLYNHTSKHIDLTNETKENIKEDILSCKKYLDSLGLFSSKYLAYPLGKVSKDVRDVVSEMNFTGRGLKQRIEVFPEVNKTDTCCIEVRGTTTSAEIISTIQEAAKNKAHITVLMHKVEDSSTGTISTTKKILEEILVEIQRLEELGQIKSITTKELSYMI